MHAIDSHLLTHGIVLVRLPWKEFELQPDDSDHFTWRGYLSFADALADALGEALADALGVLTGAPLHIVADSTIGYWDIDAHGRDTRAASQHLERLLRARLGVAARVDAVNGSGFVARSDEGLHFRPRVRRAAPEAVVVLVGGWNDKHAASHRVHGAIDALVRPVRPLSRTRALN